LGEKDPMRAVVQRVRWAEVELDNRVIGRIGPGLLVYAGVAVGDTANEAWNLADKVAHLPVFEDPQGKLNFSVQDVRGGVLAISDVTHTVDHGSDRGAVSAHVADPETAARVFESFVTALRVAGVVTQQGLFGAAMHIRSEGDGPIRAVLDVSPVVADLPVAGLAALMRRKPSAPL
jgi:D-aminoacyl-tRNA deacylase